MTPDILCLSKGLTGGSLPLAVTMASEAIFEAHFSTDRAKTFFHSSSYTANPIACAAAAANLAIWREEPVLERVANLAAKQQAMLDELSSHPLVHNSRRCGTITAFEVGPVGSTYLSQTGPRLLDHFRENNLLVRPLGNTVYVMPPYCIDDADIGTTYDGILAGLDKLARPSRAALGVFQNLPSDAS